MPSLVCGFAQTVYFAKSKEVHSAFAHILQIWNGSLFGLSLATNITVTLLISLRVWYMLRDFGGKKYFPYFKVLLVIIESGMIYSVALICEITLYFLKSNAFYIVYDPIAQLTVSPVFFPLLCCCISTLRSQAIVPTMIIVLVGLELTSNDVHSRMTKVSRPRFQPGGESGSDEGKFTSNFQMESMQFNTRSMLSSKDGATSYTSTFSDSYPNK